jgi:hypothetical protein
MPGYLSLPWRPRFQVAQAALSHFRGSIANANTQWAGVQRHPLGAHRVEPGGHVFGALEVAEARISNRLVLGSGPGLRFRPQATYRDILTCYTFSPTNPRVKRRQT